MYTIKQEELSEKAYKAIKDLILQGELTSGEKLNQEGLAKRLGISRTPLLSAFAKLEKEMLVELIPRRGARVKKLSRKEYIDLYDLRLRLEPLGAFEATQRKTKEGLKEIEKYLSLFEAVILGRSKERFLEVDYKFHMAVMKMSQNEMLYRMISAFNIVLISNFNGLLKEPDESLREHKALAEAIKSGDAPLAEKIMYEHISGARANLLLKEDW